MGFSIFVSRITDDDRDLFDRAVVERAFEGIAVDLSGDYWNLRMSDGEISSSTISIADEPKVANFGVDRPPSYEGFPQFWDAMFEVLRQTCTIVFWPDDGPHPNYCFANSAILAKLPTDGFFDRGIPAVVSSGAEIDAAIRLTGH